MTPAALNHSDQAVRSSRCKSGSLSTSLGCFRLKASEGLQTANKFSAQWCTTGHPCQRPAPATTRNISFSGPKTDVRKRPQRGGFVLGLSFEKAAEPMDEPLGSKIRRCAHGQHARTLPLYQA